MNNLNDSSNKYLKLSRNLLFLSVCAGLLGMLAWLSLARYWGYNSGMYDLGNMSQAIWSATQSEPLLFTAQGIPVSRLSRHVELFYFALAPLYALIPRPETLLIVQVALYGLGIWPVYHLTRRRTESWRWAMALSLIYLLYPVGQTAVLHDFHGDTLAVPFLLLAIDAIDRHDNKQTALWIVLALSCKFYVAAPITALGVLMFWLGRKKLGLALFSSGLAWGVIAFFIIRPIFAPDFASEAVQATGTSYILYYFGQIDYLQETLFPRLLTAIVVYGPALWLGWRGWRWFLPVSAIAIPVLLSSGPSTFNPEQHHHALTVPFLLAAMIYGAETLRRKSPFEQNIHLIVAVALVFTSNSLIVDTPLSASFYNPPANIKMPRGLDSSKYGQTQRDLFKTQWLDTHIPPYSPLATNVSIAPHLSNRSILYLTSYRHTAEARVFPEFLDELDYVIVDALFDFRLGEAGKITQGGPLLEQGVILYMLQADDFSLIQADDGLLLFAKNSPNEPLKHHINILDEPASTAPLATFDQKIALYAVKISKLGSHRFEISYQWQALQDLSQQAPLLAVTHIEGIAHQRLVHLGSYALQTTPTWPTQQLIQETFTFELPPSTPAGVYNLNVAWYDSENIFSPETDERSQIAPPVSVGQISIGE